MQYNVDCKAVKGWKLCSALKVKSRFQWHPWKFGWIETERCSQAEETLFKANYLLRRDDKHFAYETYFLNWNPHRKKMKNSIQKSYPGPHNKTTTLQLTSTEKNPLHQKHPEITLIAIGGLFSSDSLQTSLAFWYHLHRLPTALLSLAPDGAGLDSARSRALLLNRVWAFPSQKWEQGT